MLVRQTVGEPGFQNHALQIPRPSGMSGPVSPTAPPMDKRREPRYNTHGFVAVRSIEPTVEEKISARILDISRRGIRLYSRRRFEIGSTLHVFLKQTLLIGQVRYCRSMGAGFEFGILIEKAADDEAAM